MVFNVPRYRTLAFLGYPKHRVGDDGSVWSWRWNRWNKLKGWINPDGYVVTTLSYKTRSYPFCVHRLVLLAFVGPCPEGMETRHYPDRTRTNNRLSNLSWGTVSENRQDRTEHGTFCGESVPWHKLSEEEVQEILSLKGHYSGPQLGLVYGVSSTTIYAIWKRKHWKNLTR